MATASFQPALWRRKRRSSRSAPGRSLAAVPAGTTVRIDALEGDPKTRFRLLELGFTPGQEITPVASAPFGGPVAVALRGTIVALRPAEADCIKLA